jgi:hypothetical protein
MMFMTNETRGMLSSLFECVHAHADLRTHRTAPFPAQVADKIDTFIAEQSALAWPAPVSGSMGVKAASSAWNSLRDELVLYPDRLAPAVPIRRDIQDDRKRN